MFMLCTNFKKQWHTLPVFINSKYMLSYLLGIAFSLSRDVEDTGLFFLHEEYKL